jgi:predicted nucleic acid-binding protein
MYLLDTNILSELVKRQPNRNLMRKLGAVPGASLYTASVCVMELRYGALRRGDGGVLWAKIHEYIISRVSVLGFGLKEAVTAGEILNGLHAKGVSIGVEDLLIGSIALSNGLAVVSANARHFSQIPNLPLENWLL